MAQKAEEFRLSWLKNVWNCSRRHDAYCSIANGNIVKQHAVEKAISARACKRKIAPIRDCGEIGRYSVLASWYTCCFVGWIESRPYWINQVSQLKWKHILKRNTRHKVVRPSSSCLYHYEMRFVSLCERIHSSVRKDTLSDSNISSLTT